jgi:NadR type nicotinamide-nucleotide adenylyltransferase
MEKNAATTKHGICLKRIALVGPESTGKSTLAKQLAAHYNTVWVPEVARSYIGALNRPYMQQDVERIAQQQVEAEEKLAERAEGYLFCDTNLLVIKIWMQHAYGAYPAWIDTQLRAGTYSLYLLTDIDLPWEWDEQREHPHLRQHLFNRYKEELEKEQLPYVTIRGQGDVRFQNAVSLLKKHAALV